MLVNICVGKRVLFARQCWIRLFSHFRLAEGVAGAAGATVILPPQPIPPSVALVPDESSQSEQFLNPHVIEIRLE